MFASLCGQLFIGKKSMLKHEIPYQSDSSTIFARIADKPWAVFLDSGQPDSQFGHYDIMVADPFIRLVTNGEKTEIFDSKGLKKKAWC